MDNTNRADLLWRTLAGLFGADSLERKFGKSPPREWIGLLRTLSDFDLQRGLRRLAYCGKGHVPTLPEFLKLCREVASDQFPDEQRKPAPESHQLSGPQSLRWAREGNLHLLSYITKQGAKRVYYLGDALTQPLVDAKNYWSQDMRDMENAGQLPPDGGKAIFAEYIHAAEAIIADRRAA